MPIKFDKPVLTVEEQLKLLESRGLIIPDKDKASLFLNFINYYRFSGYTICFENIVNGKRNHSFLDGTTFENVRIR